LSLKEKRREIYHRIRVVIFDKLEKENEWKGSEVDKGDTV
jgi:hypothetical protein